MHGQPMYEKKPTPVMSYPRSNLCPGCGKKSYSLGGIHPQCAVNLADLPIKNRLAAERKAKAKAKQDQ